MRNHDRRLRHLAAIDSGNRASFGEGKKLALTVLILLALGIGASVSPLVSAADEAPVQAADEVAATEQVENAPDSPAAEEEQTPADDQAPEPAEQTIPILDHWKRLGKPGGSEVWLDTKNKSVILAGHICLTRGGLEMFVCPINTKEHESVIAAHATSAEVHAALLAIGAEPGEPVQWEPVQKSASGSVIEVRVTWRDPDSNRTVTRWGKEMVRDFRDGKGLSHDWVFGGSILEKDPESGESYYYGDSGPLLCVSNFATACMDINVPSSASNGNLLYEAFTENLPAKGTKVYVQLKPGEFLRGK